VSRPLYATDQKRDKVQLLFLIKAEVLSSYNNVKKLNPTYLEDDYELSYFGNLPLRKYGKGRHLSYFSSRQAADWN